MITTLASRQIPGKYVRRYKQANQVIALVPGITMDDPQSRLIAEAKFLRGLFYLTHPFLSSSPYPGTFRYQFSASRQSGRSLAQVANDFTEAAAGLRSVMKYCLGRATRGAHMPCSEKHTATKVISTSCGCLCLAGNRSWCIKLCFDDQLFR